jgi:hypothetical protein
VNIAGRAKVFTHICRTWVKILGWAKVFTHTCRTWVNILGWAKVFTHVRGRWRGRGRGHRPSWVAGRERSIQSRTGAPSRPVTTPTGSAVPGTA